MKAKNTKHGGKHSPTYKLIPLAFSICGGYSSSAQDLLKEFGKMKAEMEAKAYLEASDIAKLGIRARETARLRRRLSLVLQNVLACLPNTSIRTTSGNRGTLAQHAGPSHRA